MPISMSQVSVLPEDEINHHDPPESQLHQETRDPDDEDEDEDEDNSVLTEGKDTRSRGRHFVKDHRR
jgi:hypothetical protein